MRILAFLVAVLVLAPAGRAQIYEITFRDAKIEKRYKRYLTHVKGRNVVLGEAKLGIRYDGAKNSIQYHPKSNELWVADPSDPSKVPYKLDRDGNKKTAGKKAVLSFPGNEVKRVAFFNRNQTLLGLAREYEIKQAQIAAIEKEQKQHKKASEPWFALQGHLISSLESLQSWLGNTGYSAAADKLDREITRQRRSVLKSAVAERAKAAQESVRVVDIPAALAPIADQITGQTYGCVESQHLRFFYPQDRVDEERALQLAQLGEKCIEGFRTEMVDPYRSEDFPDQIPDDVFHEWFFCENDNSVKERFLEEFYKGSFSGPHSDKRLEAMGNGFQGLRGQPHVHMWKMGENPDLEGQVVHNLGHSLGSYHYAANVRGVDWIEEAVGYYLSFEYLGRNTVTCFQHLEPAYGRKKKEEGEKDVLMGERDYFQDLALEKGPAIDALTLKSLGEMTTVDFAKAWSMYEFVVKNEGWRGQEWLRATCRASRVKSTFMRRLRQVSEDLFEVEGEDVFKVIEDRWREYALRWGAVGGRTR